MTATGNPSAGAQAPAAPSQEGSAGVALGQQVNALARDAAQLLDSVGRDDLAQSIRDELGRRSAGVATVVVVGETNRGKSALVNAMLELPGLSPVDADVATNCYVEIKRAEEPYALVSLAGEPEPRPIGVDEIAAYATVTGNPGNEKGVRSVEVGLNKPFLEGLRLIDTPGVGGLETAHGELTLEVLREADALLLVIDTDGPLAAPELRFLERAAERIDTVIIALTKIDVERRWEELRSADAALLREHAPRFAGAPIVPVSSLRLEQSLALEPGDRAARRRAGSGIDELQELIRTRVARRSAVLHLANATRVAQGTLAAIVDSLADKLAAVDNDPSFERLLEQKQARLNQLEEDLAGWQDQFNSELEMMQLERNRDLGNSMRAIQREYMERVGKVKKDQQGELVADLEAELSALARRLAYQSADRVARTLEEMLGITGSEQALTGTAGRLKDDLGPGLSLSDAPDDPKLATADKLSVASGFMMGTRVPTLAGMILPGMAGPAGILVAGAGVAWMVLTGRSRKRAIGEAELRTWIREQLAEAQIVLRDDFAERMISVRQEIKRITRRQVAERRKELAEAQKEYRDAAAATAGQRDRRKKELGAQLARVRTLQQTAERLQAAMASIGSESAPSL